MHKYKYSVLFNKRIGALVHHTTPTKNRESHGLPCCTSNATSSSTSSSNKKHLPNGQIANNKNNNKFKSITRIVCHKTSDFFYPLFPSPITIRCRTVLALAIARINSWIQIHTLTSSQPSIRARAYFAVKFIVEIPPSLSIHHKNVFEYAMCFVCGCLDEYNSKPCRHKMDFDDKVTGRKSVMSVRMRRYKFVHNLYVSTTFFIRTFEDSDTVMWACVEKWQLVRPCVCVSVCERRVCCIGAAAGSCVSIRCVVIAIAFRRRISYVFCP